jgi:hypothetical protein
MQALSQLSYGPTTWVCNLLKSREELACAAIRRAPSGHAGGDHSKTAHAALPGREILGVQAAGRPRAAYRGRSFAIITTSTHWPSM